MNNLLKTSFMCWVACCALAIPKKLPDKTVVLTFDDSVKSHLTVAAPLLKKHGFGATFFVTHAWMNDKDNYLNWKEIAKLDKMGFEIGNHSWSHLALHDFNAKNIAEEEILKVEQELKKADVSKPVSFSWPGNHFGPETLKILRKLGYKFARRGPQPGIPSSEILGAGELYNPQKNDPLLIPSSGLAVPSWSLEDFKKIVAPTKNGNIVVLQLHGVPDNRHPFCSTPAKTFEKFVEYLSKEKFNVIAMRDLEKYVDSDKLPEDLLIKQRFYSPDKPMTIPIIINDEKIANKNFLGFGAEWDSYAYDDNKINAKDFSIIEKRIEWMEIPIMRIMMIANWCYLGNGKYDWNTRDMKELYRHLDLCQKLGITVFLTEWGCNDNWLKIPDVEKINDKKYAKIIVNYLDYLINVKKYSCIKYFILGNEPNLSGYGWEPWKEGVKNLVAEIKNKKLDKKIILAGSDQSCGDDWHEKAVDQLQDYFGVYDNHKYANDEMVRPGKLFDYFKGLNNYALKHDKNAKNKPFIVGEAGLNNFAKHPYGNEKIDTFYYGVFMADYAVQAVNAGSSAVFNWMLDDNSHLNFYWGLWKDKKNGLKLRTYFYVWSLLTKYFPPKSVVYNLGKVSDDVRVLAVSMSSSESTVDSSTEPTVGKIPLKKEGVRVVIKDWSFCFVNRGTQPIKIELKIPDEGKRKFKIFNYSEKTIKVNKNGFPIPNAETELNLSEGAELICEGESVKILTTK